MNSWGLEPENEVEKSAVMNLENNKTFMRSSLLKPSS